MIFSRGTATQKILTNSLLLLLLQASFFACTKKTESSSDSSKIEAQATGQAADKILIGEYGSMTGSEATFGQSTHNGILLAVEEQNKAGGIKGKQIELLTEDDQGKTDVTAAVVTRLITQKKVVALLGEVASGLSKVAAPIAQQYKVPMISPSSTDPEVTQKGDYIFRVCFIDPFQGTVMAKFAFDNLKSKKVAVLRDANTPYSVGLAKFFKETFTKLGGEVVAFEDYQKGDIDFKSQLTKIKNKSPEAIFIPGYYTDVGSIARQARQLGIKAPLLGGDGWDSPKLFEIGKESINGSYFSNHYTTESTDPKVQDFIKTYKARFNNEVPSGLAASGYDAAKILFAAMEKSDMSSKSIRDLIAQTKDYVAVTGKITLDANRDAVKSAVVVKVDGAINRFVTTINP